MFVLREKYGVKYLEIEEFKKSGIKAVFTTRIGGVSQGDYESLNLGLHTGDNPLFVLDNRQKAAKLISADSHKLVAGKQVHGNQSKVVKESEQGRGAVDEKDSIPEVDALITDKEGLPLISFYADCVPLYIFDPVKRVAALAHAGWRGTVKKIASKTIFRMKEKFGINPEDCLAAIGPAICRDHYIVDDRVINEFKNAFSLWRQLVSPRDSGDYLLDLKKANYLLFREMGLYENNIIISDMCTFCEEKYFYSYRRDGGKTGRMASLLVM